MTSYQHSLPGQQLNIEMASADENDPLYSNEQPRPAFHTKRRLMAVMAFGIVMLFATMTLNSHGNAPTTALLEADSMPDANNPEGQYDWKKCKESNDPDCWKKEGERVGGFWHNFGLKWKAFWGSLFGKKTKSTDQAPVEAPTEETTTKKHKSKAPKKAADEAPAAKETKS